MIEQRIDATEDLPTGENLILSASFEKDGEDPPGVSTGIAVAVPRRPKVGEGRIKTQPGTSSWRARACASAATAAMPVTDDYPGEPPYRFTGGTINRVAVDVSGEPYLDLEREAEAMLARE